MRAALLALAACATAPPAAVHGYTPAQCPHCAEWNAPHAPLRVFGNTYWVGTAGLGSVLVTSPQGHVLIDGALPESAPQIAAHVRALGFKVEDIKLILNSHAHYDHAGGIAALQQLSGAQVAASPASAREISTGRATPDDPQAAIALGYPAAHAVRAIADGETVHVGPLALTAHFTPGHTPGGTTWTWRSCEGARCLDLVYADSQTAVSSEDYRFTQHPEVLAGFARGLAVIEQLPCDLLITPHPAASQLWERLAAGTLVDREACRRYVAEARENVAKRVATESGRDGQ